MRHRHFWVILFSALRRWEASLHPFSNDCTVLPKNRKRVSAPTSNFTHKKYRQKKKKKALTFVKMVMALLVIAEVKPANYYTSNVDRSGHKMAEQMKLLWKVGHINDQCKCVKPVRTTPLAFHTYLCSTQGQACPCFCAKWQGGRKKRGVSAEMGGEGQVQVFSNSRSCRKQELRMLAVIWSERLH